MRIKSGRAVFRFFRGNLQMNKAEAFFLIHNYNTVPDDLLAYCREDNYEIVDCSDDGRTPQILRDRGLRVTFVPNTGHNITTYFAWFAEHYDSLPELIMTGKGNMIGRHVSAEYMNRAACSTWFTYLYEEKAARERYSKATAEVLAAHGGKDPGAGSIAFLTSESNYLELNSSWYMEQPTHRWEYFGTYDDLLTFVYRDPVIPKYVSFAPGGCYIVSRDQIRHHSPAFYRNLNKLMNYTLTPGFPAEAYIVERMLPVIYAGSYEVNPWMDDEPEFDRLIAERRASNEGKRRLLEQEAARRNRGIPGLLRRVKHALH